MSYRLLIDPSEINKDTLKSLLGDSPKESMNRDRKRLAIKGEDLTQEEADQVLSDYLADKASLDADYILTQKLEKVVEKAMEHGKDIIKKYGAKNMKAGKSDEDIDNIIDDLGPIINALSSGSLKSARRKAIAFTPTSYVPQEDIDWVVSELDKILGA